MKSAAQVKNVVLRTCSAKALEWAFPTARCLRLGRDPSWSRVVLAAAAWTVGLPILFVAYMLREFSWMGTPFSFLGSTLVDPLICGRVMGGTLVVLADAVLLLILFAMALVFCGTFGKPKPGQQLIQFRDLIPIGFKYATLSAHTLTVFACLGMVVVVVSPFPPRESRFYWIPVMCCGYALVAFALWLGEQGVRDAVERRCARKAGGHP